MRRFASAVVLGLLLSVLVGSSVQALAIASHLTVNDQTEDVQPIIGQAAIGRGSITFDTYVGPVPIPLDCYIVDGVPWWPFSTPSYVGGNSGPGGFSVGYNVNGSKAYLYTKKNTILGNYTYYTNVKVVVDYATSPLGHWWTYGSGSGHMTDSNTDVLVTSRIR